MSNQPEDTTLAMKPVQTVAGQVLTTFFDELDKVEDMSDISAN